MFALVLMALVSSGTPAPALTAAGAVGPGGPTGVLFLCVQAN